MQAYLTNSPAHAKAFRRANRAESAARTAARNLSLADKLAALRTARETREDAFKAILLGYDIIPARAAGMVNVVGLDSGYTFGGIHGMTRAAAWELINGRTA